MTPEEFRKAGHALVEWIARYREQLPERPVMSGVRPGEIRARLPAVPPEQGLPLEALLPALDQVVLPGITHWNHPRFFAYFPSNTDLASVLADLVSSGLGAQGMSWQTSPAATEVEEVVMDWLRQGLGLSSAFTGVIQDTASTATLTALLCARERATGFSQNRGGLQAEEAPLAVYASEQSHSSIEKGALLAGFGKANLRLLPTDASLALRLDALEQAMADDAARGIRPCAVVACVGTTATTAMDPVRGIAELARRHGAWLHVDAALAGTAMLLPECRPLWDGVELADSLVLNPHKWLGAGFDLSAYYVRDPQHLIRVMSTNPSYLRTAHDAEVKNLRDWGIPLGRRFRALKLWFVLHTQGLEGLRARLRRDLALARELAGWVQGEPGWELAAPLTLQTVCVRHAPPGLPPPEVDAHNLALAAAVNRGGRAYVTPATVRGRPLIRVSLGAQATERADVAAVWAELKAASASGHG